MLVASRNPRDDCIRRDFEQGESMAKGASKAPAERKPDAQYRVKVDHRHEVQVYSFGKGDEVLFCLNGGPGLPCDYLRDSHSRPGRPRLSGRHSRPAGQRALRQAEGQVPLDITRYVEEVETVRKALKLGRVHLLGQSWGTWLGFEYLLTYPRGAKTFVCANGTAEIAFTFRISPGCAPLWAPRRSP